MGGQQKAHPHGKEPKQPFEEPHGVSREDRHEHQVPEDGDGRESGANEITAAQKNQQNAEQENDDEPDHCRLSALGSGKDDARIYHAIDAAHFIEHQAAELIRPPNAGRVDDAAGRQVIPLLAVGGIDPDTVDLQRPRQFERTRVMHVPLEVGDAEFFVSVGEMLLGDGDISLDTSGALRTVLRRLAG